MTAAKQMDSTDFLQELDEAIAQDATPPVREVGFGVAPSFFQPVARVLGASPAKVAEWDAARQRIQAYNHAAHTLRTATEALHRFKALDTTGQLAAGIEHFDVHVGRAEEAADKLLALAEDFAKERKL